MFFFYQIILILLFLISPLIIIFRIIKNKEDKKRFIEKFGFIKEKRTKGNLVWIHVASVGELMSVLPLIHELERIKYINSILLTTSTLSSSKYLGLSNLKKQFINFFL